MPPELTPQMLHRELHPKTTLPAEAENAPRHTLDFRSSDQTLDRYNEVITVAGWKLDNYRKNPVVQNAHSYWSLADTIGKSLITEVRNREPGTLNPARLSSPNPEPAPYLFQRIQFAVEENPMARLAYGLYKGGFLHAVSVGFIPIRWENGTQDSGYRRKYLEQELLEVSVVSIPANPNALTLGLKAGAIEKGDLKELFDLLHHSCADASPSPLNGLRAKPRRETNPPVAGVRGEALQEGEPISDTWPLQSALDEARMLRLTQQLNEIRAILKRA